MAETTSRTFVLNAIVRHTQERPTNLAHGEFPVEFSKASWISKGDYYVVTTGRPVQFPVKYLTIPVKIDDKQRTLQVDLHCELSCRRGDEHKLAGMAREKQDLDAFLNQTIHHAAADFYESHKQDVVLDFFDLKSSWEEAVAKSIQHGTGLTANVALDVGGDSLEIIHYKSAPAPVYVTDYRDELEFSIAVQLEVPAGNKNAKALAMLRLRERDKLEHELQEAVRQWIATKCTIHEFCLKETDVEKSLKTKAEEVAETFGRTVTHFKWEPKTPFSLPKLDKVITHKHSCLIRDCQEAIEVNHTVLLALKSGGLCNFLQLKCDSVEEWICQQLSRITQEELFGKDYVEVAVGFKKDYLDAENNPKTAIEKDIKKKAQVEAEQYGLEVRNYSSVPNIETVILQNGFSFRVDDEFSTKNSRFKVKLSIVGSGRIEELKDIKDYLHPGQNMIVTHIQPAIKATVEKILHDITPKRFYLQFQQLPNEAGSAGKTMDAKGSDDPKNRSVESQLGEEIVKVLHDTFSVKDCHVTVKQVDTELTERMRALVNARPSFQQEVKPKGGMPIAFHIHYRVVGVVENLWDVFLQGTKSPEAEIDDITNLIRGTFNELMMHSIDRKYMQYETIEQRVLLERLIFGDPDVMDDRHAIDDVRTAVARHHGLAIEPTSFWRGVTYDELIVIEGTKKELTFLADRQQGELDHLKTILDSLEDQEKELIAKSGPDDTGLKPIRDEINKIREAIRERSGPQAAVAPMTNNLLQHDPHEELVTRWFSPSRAQGLSRQIEFERGSKKLLPDEPSDDEQKTQ